MQSQYAPAEVNSKQLERIKQLEQSLGKVIVAVEPSPEYARLTSEQLAEIQRAERELGVVMVAYES